MSPAVQQATQEWNRLKTTGQWRSRDQALCEILARVPALTNAQAATALRLAGSGRLVVARRFLRRLLY